MSYKAGIIAALKELKGRDGSSSIAIKEHMQAILPPDKKWMNSVFVNALEKMVADGELIQVNNSYKLVNEKKSSKTKKSGKSDKSKNKRKDPNTPKKAQESINYVLVPQDSTQQVLSELEDGHHEGSNPSTGYVLLGTLSGLLGLFFILLVVRKVKKRKTKIVADSNGNTPEDDTTSPEDSIA